MNFLKAKKIHNTALFFIMLAPFSILFYSLYIFNPANAGNHYLYPFQVVADGIAIFILITLWLTLLLDLLQPEYNKRDYIYNKEFLSQNSLGVDVLIPVVREPLEIIENTILHVLKMDYPHKTYLLDDGGLIQHQELAARYGIGYIVRSPKKRKLAKSGNLNNALNYCSGDYVVIFDADFAPKKEFLTELLPFFENLNVAMVQTPQYFLNTRNFIAAGSAQAQEIFYKYIQPAKNSFNAAFCVGTNVIFRRLALDAIGGFARVEHSEDIWTSLLLHEKGYETIFYNKILAKGYTPDTISSFFRQQNRWALGGFSIFFNHNPLFSRHLTIDQKLQYFFTSFFYFSTFALTIYLVLPLIYLLFGLHPMNLSKGNEWLIHYIPYFITLYFLPLFLLKNIKIATISAAMASFVPYWKAFFATLIGKRHKWVPTGVSSSRVEIVMLRIWPHVLLILLSMFALIVGWYKVVNVTTTAVTSIWVAVNMFLLFQFIKNGVFAK